jgi:RNA-binding protein YlmH
LDKERLTSHIKNPELMTTIRRLLDKSEIVLKKHQILESDFLDPLEREMAKTILSAIDGVGLLETGGPEGTERKCLVLFPDYLDPSDIDSSIKYLRIECDVEGLSHRDFLGSLVNLGIKREKLGDILIMKDYAMLSLKAEIADFISMNLEKVGNRKVVCSIIDENEFILPDQEYLEVSCFVSSERLDVLMSAAFKLSRSVSLAMINSGDVKVNWQQTTKAGFELKPGDMISVKKFGRAIYFSKQGHSKKGRISIIIKILK